MAANQHNASAMLPDIHSGNILLDEFLLPLNIVPRDIAMRTSLSVAANDGILSGVIGIDPDIGRQLASCFEMYHGFWFGLQQSYPDEIATALCMEQ